LIISENNIKFNNMKNNLRLFNQILLGLILAFVLVFSTAENVNAVITSTNDVGITTTPSTPILTTGPTCVISQTFGDGSLPSPAGIIDTESGIQSGRLFRDAIPTTCTTNSGFSTFSPGTSYGYEAYTFSASSTGCLNVDVTELGTSGLYIAVYEDSFNPSDPDENCIGQQGSSAVVPFACPVVMGKAYILVIMETATLGGGNGVNYTASLDNFGYNPVPVSIWWIVAAFFIICGFTVYRFRLRKA
jgi:hypothetical protein